MTTPLESAGTPPGPEPELSQAGLLALLTGTFLALFDFFVVNVSLPAIGADLHATGALLTLVVAGYALAYGSGLLLGSQLGGRFGRVAVFRLAMLAFLASSALCAMAQTPATLIIGRVLQGAAIAVVIPQVLAILKLRTSGNRQRQALSWYARAIAAGQVAGQVFGGVAVSADPLGLAWRWAFILTTVAAGAGAVLARAIPEVRSTTRWDLRASLGVTAASVLFFTALAVPMPGFQTAGRLCATALGLVISGDLIRRERRRARNGQPGELAVMSSESLRRGLLAAACFYAVVTSFFFMYALYLQRGMRWSAAEAGVIFLCYAAGVNAGALVLSRAPRMQGLLNGGITAMAGGMLVVGLSAVIGRRPAAGIALAAGLIITGAGNGLVLPLIMDRVISCASARDTATVSGLLPAAQQLGGAFGVTLLGAWFLSAASRGGGNGYRGAFALGMAVEAAVLALTWLLARSPAQLTEIPDPSEIGMSSHE